MVISRLFTVEQLLIRQNLKDNMKSKEQKRTEAALRAGEYSKLSTAQKLERLPSTGATRQRAELLKKLNTTV